MAADEDVFLRSVDFINGGIKMEKNHNCTQNIEIKKKANKKIMKNYNYRGKVKRIER